MRDQYLSMTECAAAFNPKALNNNTSAGLLTCSPFPAPSHDP
jgi:hypothetical protein